MSKPLVRDNFGQFQKYATVHLTKRLKEIAQATEVNVSKIVADKLEKTYKDNVLLSYGPRSQAGREVMAYNKKRKSLEDEDRESGIKSPRRGRKKQTYKHSGTFLDSIRVEIEDKVVKVKISDDKPYDDGKFPSDIYVYLTEGTRGGGFYSYHDKRDKEGSISWAYNYPTPAHLFEEHTKVQMKSFLDTLEPAIKRR